VLWPSAVYFKSGSLYSCKVEEGFVCGKYMGNVRNYMNSVAMIETPAGQNQLHYMVSVLSNVLRKNSAVDHRDLARAVHAMLIADHPDRSSDAREYGKNFIGYEAELRAASLGFDTQEALTDLGYDLGDIDGVVGPATRKAIREFQASVGLPQNGQISEALLAKMREAAQAQGRVRPTTQP